MKRRTLVLGGAAIAASSVVAAAIWPRVSIPIIVDAAGAIRATTPTASFRRTPPITSSILKSSTAGCCPPRLRSASLPEPITAERQESPFPAHHETKDSISAYSLDGRTQNARDGAIVRQQSVAHVAKHTTEQGLARLMMRLPATRATIRAAAAGQSHLYELCGAYGEDCSILDHMRKDMLADPAIIVEYEIICAEIEANVLRTLLGDL